MQKWRSRIGWAASQVPKRRARNEFAALLVDGDLAGDGWRVIDERSWRRGLSGKEDWAVRARDAGLLTAWRSFEQGEGERWMWAQVTGLMSEVDAEGALAVLPDRFLRNARADVEVIDEHSPEPP